MASFLETMHRDPIIRKYLYEIGNDFMGGELQENVEIHNVHKLLRQVVRDIETYKATGIMRPGVYDSSDD